MVFIEMAGHRISASAAAGAASADTMWLRLHQSRTAFCCCKDKIFVRPYGG